MKLGIFGGTFNPIHYGHLINAEMIRTDFNLDKIIFVPSKYPVHKNLAGNISPEDRAAMISLAIRDVKEFEVSKIEIDRKEPSYTIVTVQELKKIYPHDAMYLIIGTDSLDKIDTWKEPETIRQNVSLIVMRRPGKEADGPPAKYAGSPGVLYADNPLIEISSTHIRERIRDGKSVRYLLPDAVIAYIESAGLYRY